MKKKLFITLSLILAVSMLAPMAFAKIVAPTDPYAAGYVDPYRPTVNIKVDGDHVTAESKDNGLELVTGQYVDESLLLEGFEKLVYEPLDQESFYYRVNVLTDEKGIYKYNLDGKLIGFYQTNKTNDGEDTIKALYDDNGKPVASWLDRTTEDSETYFEFDENGNLVDLVAWEIDEVGNNHVIERIWKKDGKWMRGSVNEDDEWEEAEVKGRIENALSKYNVYARAPHVYPHNTVCAAGLSLREENPQLTRKWYHVVPIDLTKDGETELPLVASNLFVIGKAIVSVHEGKVAVTYAYEKGRMREEGQLLNWFTSMDEITTDYLNAPEGKFEFGKEVDIATELNDAEVGYLFICNTISYSEAYRHNGDQLPSYNHGSAENTQAREALRELIK
ncbi:MAG: hypothetical protein ACOX55_05180 [Christensenellales bacterium]|jgi:hypothetical protein